MKPYCLQNLPSRSLHKFNVWGLGSNSATLVSTSFYASVKKLEKQEAKLIPEVIPFTEVDWWYSKASTKEPINKGYEIHPWNKCIFFFKCGLKNSISDISCDYIPQKAKYLLENCSLLTIPEGINRCFNSLFRLENISSTLKTKIHVISMYLLCFLL